MQKHTSEGRSNDNPSSHAHLFLHLRSPFFSSSASIASSSSSGARCWSGEVMTLKKTLVPCPSSMYRRKSSSQLIKILSFSASVDMANKFVQRFSLDLCVCKLNGNLKMTHWGYDAFRFEMGPENYEIMAKLCPTDPEDFQVGMVDAGVSLENQVLKLLEYWLVVV